MLLYRYLKTHSYETLRDAEFMVSAPGKFNDILDCTAKVTSTPSRDALDKYYNQDKDWFDIGVDLGLDGAELQEFLNYPNKAPTPERYKEVLQHNLATHKTVDNVFRILCLCDAGTHPKTDLHMWKKYAGKCGVRIGLNVDPQSTEKQFVFKKVEYADAIPEIDLKANKEISTRFDYLKIISTKTKKWALEREWRLCLLAKRCYTKDGLEFLGWDRRMLASVDIGCGMSVAAQKGLFRMVRKRFPLNVEIKRMVADEKFSGISYEDVPKSWRT